MKKLITIVLAMVMVLSLCTLSAFADGLRDFDSAKGDKLSYDQILVNGAEIANGNSAVIAAKTHDTKGVDLTAVKGDEWDAPKEDAVDTGQT